MKGRLLRMKEYLNSREILFYSLLYVILYLSAAFAAAKPYDWNLTSLIHFGHDYTDLNGDYTPEGAVVFTGNETYGGNGYDGQIFYYYARTLFVKNVWPSGFNRAYRAPRIGYPFIAGIFSVFGSYGTVFGMFVVQILLGLAGTFALYKLLSQNLRFLLIFYIFSPFSLQSYLLLVSDAVMVSLVLCGYYFYSLLDNDRFEFKNILFSFSFFSLAVLTKEPALFFLFPLGLNAVYDRNWKKSLLMIAILLPMIFWQIYLRQVHGMLPAGVLQIFLSPFSGIYGLLLSTFQMIGDFLKMPSLSMLIGIFKHSVKWLLVLMIAGAVPLLMKGNRLNFPFRFAASLILMSVLFADYYYFWGIYENISRMFTLLVPSVILLLQSRGKFEGRMFFSTLSLLSLFVLLRVLFMNPAFPYELYQNYEGPSYSGHARILYVE